MNPILFMLLDRLFTIETEIHPADHILNGSGKMAEYLVRSSAISCPEMVSRNVCRPQINSPVSAIVR